MKRYGFSLTEVLLAVAVLSVGFLCVAGTFLVGFHFTGQSAERTMAPIVANEAFAKVRLFMPRDPNWIKDVPEFCVDVTGIVSIDPNEFFYPSIAHSRHTYIENEPNATHYWQAVCRRATTNSLQLTVFACRKVGIRPVLSPQLIPVLGYLPPDILDVGLAGPKIPNNTFAVGYRSGQIGYARKLENEPPNFIAVSPEISGEPALWVMFEPATVFQQVVRP